MLFSIISFLIVVGLHLGLIVLSVFKINLQNQLMFDCILLLLFSLGTWLGHSGKTLNYEKFVQKFLLTTTAQLLSTMGLIAWITFSKFDHPKSLGFHTISVFVILLGFQSYFFIRKIQKKN